MLGVQSSSTITEIKQLPMLGIVDQTNTMAFAKLEGNGVLFYMQNLEITLGRKYPNEKHADLPLSYEDSISKFHALIFYNFYSTRYELTVTGRTNAYVNRKLVTIGSTLPLESNCSIQIGDVELKFTLPDAAEVREYKQGKRQIEENKEIRTTKYQDSPTLKAETVEEENLSQDEFYDAEDDYKGNSNKSDSDDSDDMDNDDGDYNDDAGSDFESDASYNEMQQEEMEPIYKIVNSFKHKPEKPPFPVFVILACALNQTQNKGMTAKELYEHLTDNFPYFKSIREDKLMRQIYQSAYVQSVKFNSHTRGHNSSVYKVQSRGLAQALRKHVNQPLLPSESRPDPYAIIRKYKSRVDKPPFSLIILCAFVFKKSKHTSMTVPEVYTRIINCFPYWKSSNKTYVTEALRKSMIREKGAFIDNQTTSSVATRWSYKPDQAYEEKLMRIVQASVKGIEAVKSNNLGHHRADYIEAYKIIDEHRSDEGAPPFPLHTLAAYALYKANKKMMLGRQIMSVITEHFPYFKSQDQQKLYEQMKHSMSAANKFLSMPTEGQSVRMWFINPDKDYDIKSYVEKCLRSKSILKYHEENKSGPYNIDPDNIIDQYAFQEEEPPFPLHVLAAHALCKSGRVEISMADIINHLLEFFPFYKSIPLDSMRSRMRSQLSARKGSVFLCIPSHPKYVYTFDPSADFESIIQNDIKESVGQLLNIKRAHPEEEETIETTYKRIKVEEEEHDAFLNQEL